MEFLETAVEQGLPVKQFYTLSECAKVSGWPYRTLLAECHAGRLRCKQAGEAERGRRVRPEWMEEWEEEYGDVR